MTLDLLSLLGREALNIPEAKLFNYRQRVVVTGAGGSIGSALVHHLAGNVDFLGCIGHSEAPIFALKQRYGLIPTVDYEVRDAGYEPKDWISRWRPDLIIHTAAHKHVGLMENQPKEAYRNNAETTIKIASTARHYGVNRVVFMSTDKAVNPTCVMGASKRMAEAWLLTNASALSSVCRCGNVIGSSGSLVEIIQDQITSNKPVTLTDPDMKRYFVTPREVVDLLLAAASVKTGLYTLNMGEPYNIENIIRRVAAALGKPNYPIQIGQPVSGEKKDEALVGPSERWEPCWNFMGFDPGTALVRIATNLESGRVDDALRAYYSGEKTIVEAANSL